MEREEALEGSTKESPWHSGIIVFRPAVFLIGRSKPLFSVIFEALHLVQPGLTAGWQTGRLAGCSADEAQETYEF